jgi:hypothetical protein
MNGSVDILANVNPLALSGSKDGYEYRLIQTNDSGLIYTITSPSGEAKIFTISSRPLVQELINSPMDFWNKYISQYV